MGVLDHPLAAAGVGSAAQFLKLRDLYGAANVRDKSKA
jgi:hypothetical protein